MVLNDDQIGGEHREQISAAFAAHGVFLGSSAVLMPKLALAGKAPAMRARSMTGALAPETLRDIRRRIDAPTRARFAVARIRLGSSAFVEAVHEREVELGSLTKDLEGVVAKAPESVLVGESGGTAAAFSSMPDPTTTEDEVLKFVETLLAHDRIEMNGKRPSVRSRSTGSRTRAIGDARQTTDLTTHVLKTTGGKKMLTRIRFLCGCCR
jgi:hypothetical protein